MMRSASRPPMRCPSTPEVIAPSTVPTSPIETVNPKVNDVRWYTTVNCCVAPAITAVSNPNSSPPKAPVIVLFSRYVVIFIYEISEIQQRCKAYRERCDRLHAAHHHAALSKSLRDRMMRPTRPPNHSIRLQQNVACRQIGIIHALQHRHHRHRSDICAILMLRRQRHRHKARILHIIDADDPYLL